MDLEFSAEYFLLNSNCSLIFFDKGLFVEGIFRISGSAAQLKELQKTYAKGKGDLVNTDPTINIHTVSGLLKNYFRDSANPLFTFENYHEFLNISSVFIFLFFILFLFYFYFIFIFTILFAHFFMIKLFIILLVSVNENERVEYLRDKISQLPTLNQEILHWLEFLIFFAPFFT